MSELKRSLSLAMLVFYGTGMILGAGIYSILGKAAGPAGDTLWISFLAAAIAVSLTALSYAELSGMFPKAGAEFVFLTKAFPALPWLGFAVGIAVVFSGAATAATVSIAFSNYLNEFVELPQLAVAGGLIVLFTGIAVIGIQASTWANVLFTLIEAAGLFIIIYLGLQSPSFGEAITAMPHWGTLAGSALVIFSFFGFENIVNLSEEAKNPLKDIPRAIIISLVISSALYVAVSVAALALVDAKELADSRAPLMMIAQKTSQSYGVVLGIIALFSTANTALISLIGASRLLYGIAKTGALPKLFARVSTSAKSPWIASLALLVLASAFLPLGKIEVIASVSSFATLAAYGAVNAALISLRYTNAEDERPFKIPLSIGRLPILPVLGILTSLVFVLQFDWLVYVIGGGFLAVTTVAFLLTSARRKPTGPKT